MFNFSQVHHAPTLKMQEIYPARTLRGATLAYPHILVLAIRFLFDEKMGHSAGTKRSGVLEELFGLAVVEFLKNDDVVLVTL
jgi:hypothetical protein